MGFFSTICKNHLFYKNKLKIVLNRLTKIIFFLRQYREKTSANVDTNYFSTVIKVKYEFADRFEQFKTNKITLVFIVSRLKTNSNEIHIEPFGIENLKRKGV